MRGRLILLLSVLVPSAIVGCYGSQQPADPRAIMPQLVALLQDPNPEVRRTAALSLGKIGDSGAIDPLVKGLRDPDPLVRKNSAWALGNTGDAALKPAGMGLVEALEDDSSEEVKQAAAQAIGNIAGPGGAPQSLVEAIMDALRDPDVRTRRAAVSTLSLIEARSSYLALVDALRDEDARVRQGAVAALGELADPRALLVLAERLARDPDPGVRAEIAFRLGKFGDETIVEPLRAAAAGDPDHAVRRWAAWAVQSIAGETLAMGNRQWKERTEVDSRGQKNGVPCMAPRLEFEVRCSRLVR